jgi:hypothetical protein
MCLVGMGIKPHPEALWCHSHSLLGPACGKAFQPTAHETMHTVAPLFNRLFRGAHLSQFCLRAAHYGSSDLCVDSPNITLAELQLRKGTRFLYEYDLNIPWCHEIRVEDKLEGELGKSYPRCIGGEGHCPPEGCAGPAGFMGHRNSMDSMASWEDLHTMVEIAREILME